MPEHVLPLRKKICSFSINDLHTPSTVGNTAQNTHHPETQAGLDPQKLLKTMQVKKKQYII